MLPLISKTSRLALWTSVARAHQGKHYAAGYLFGARSLKETESPSVLRRSFEEKLIKFGQKPGCYEVWDTPLENYGIHSSHFKKSGKNFKEHVLEMAEEFEKQGKTLRILEIGVGSGQQSLFLLGHPNISYQGTALSVSNISPQLQGHVRECTAANLHQLFPPNSFDMVFSFFGINDQLNAAFENSLYVAAPKGEIFLFGIGSAIFFTSYKSRFFDTIDSKNLIISHNSNYTSAGLYHVIKKEPSLFQRLALLAAEVILQ